MCHKGVLFCSFYYLGFLFLFGVLIWGLIIALDFKKNKKEKSGKNEQ